MSYRQALEAAGADIEAFESFGSYQGDWIAKIGYDKYVRGSYGSCSACDAFEAEFGYDERNAEDYEARLADFGRTYLDGEPWSKEALLELFREQAEWDSDAEGIVDWLTTGAGK